MNAASTLTALDRCANALSRLGILLSGGFIALVTAMIFINVLLRSLFGINLPFAEEWASLSLIPMAYLGLGYTLRRGKHIAADIVLSRVPVRVRRLMLLAVAVFSLFVLVFFLERGWELLSYNWARHVTTNGPMRTPMWIPSLAMFAGLLIFALDIVFWIVHLALGLRGRDGLLFTD